MPQSEDHTISDYTEDQPQPKRRGCPPGGWPKRKEKYISRAEQTQDQRRRRSDSYRGYDLRLDVPEHLKDPNYTYRWINDERGRLQTKTTQDDWDFVAKNELMIASHDDGGFDAKNKSETDGRIRREVTSATSPRPIFAYLCKKKKEYVEADFREEMNMNKRRMSSVLHNQDAGGDGSLTASAPKHVYIPKEIKAAIGVTDARIRRARGRDSEEA